MVKRDPVAVPANMRVTYPAPFVLFQRDTPTEGDIHVRGAYAATSDPKMIEARFNGGEWVVLDSKLQDGVFHGSLRAPVGQGALEVRATSDHALHAMVTPVAVGDLFLIAGQSNADGRGKNMVKLDPSNPYTGVKYRKGIWSEGCDPSANDEDKGSPWPAVLNRLIPERNVPMGFIAAAVGSTVVRQWRKIEGATAQKPWNPGGMYARASEMVKSATDGSMKIRAVLYYQGENDLTHWNKLTVMGDYGDYKANLMAAISDFWNDFHVPVLVGQITYESDRGKCDNIRRAQQEVWEEHPHALPGPITYDISGEFGWTGHYTTAGEMKAYADRWAAAILCGVYCQHDMAGPKLLSLRREGGNRLVLTYDQPMDLKSWDGKTGRAAEGFRFMEGDRALADVRVTATEIRGKGVTIELSRPIPDGVRVDYGGGADGQGRVTLRNAGTGLPAPMLFGRDVERFSVSAGTDAR